MLSCLDSIFRIAFLSYESWWVLYHSRVTSQQSRVSHRFQGEKLKNSQVSQFLSHHPAAWGFYSEGAEILQDVCWRNIHYKILLTNSTFYHFWRIGNVRKHLAHYVNRRLILDIHRGLRSVSTIKPIYKQNHWKTRSCAFPHPEISKHKIRAVIITPLSGDIFCFRYWNTFTNDLALALFPQRLKFEIAEVMTEIEQLTCIGERLVTGAAAEMKLAQSYYPSTLVSIKSCCPLSWAGVWTRHQRRGPPYVPCVCLGQISIHFPFCWAEFKRRRWL